MTRNEKIRFVVLRSIGNFLVLFCVYGSIATFGPVFLQDARYHIEQAKGISYTVKAEEQVASTEKPLIKSPQQTVFDPLKDGFAAILGDTEDRILIPPDANFSILIPKLGASATVVANVDTESEEAIHESLQRGVAHAKGTVFPGLPGNTYLFAHSTDNWWNVARYNAVFYLLKDLKEGDEVVVFFESTRHNYIVSETFIADPSDVSLLVNAQGIASNATAAEEKLVLQTCWPPGTTWKRLFVIAKSKSD